jgi:hypothetical protein
MTRDLEALREWLLSLGVTPGATHEMGWWDLTV